jgi:type IV pilus assembly protein PilB
MSRLTEALLRSELITSEQLAIAEANKKTSAKSLQQLLIELGFVKEEDLLRVLGEVFNLELLSLDNETIDSSVTHLLPQETARQYRVFPVRKENDTLLLAVSDLLDIITLDNISFITNLRIKPALSSRSEIMYCIEQYYDPLRMASAEFCRQSDGSMKTEKTKDYAGREIIGANTFNIEELKCKSSPAVILVNVILSAAVKSRATDIHIEPHEQYVDVRYRIDGALRSMLKVPNKFRASLVGRIKILTDLDITETRKPHDGRTRIILDKKVINLRISTIPTVYGEKVALRLLDIEQVKLELTSLSLKESELNAITEAISRPQGMMLVTGPTGSGKTTTLYAALNFIKKCGSKNIVTIEDPIEYVIEGVNQMQVNPVKNITFANGLRSILRQDPNVILVGEIRDVETAEIAFRSALTGHLVLSTLHTNSAVAAITRLMDIGLQSYLIASPITLIIAQRLVRLTCTSCKTEYVPDGVFLHNFKYFLDKFKINKFYKGKGCKECDFTGYLGRIAFFEMLKINEQIRKMIASGASEDVLYNEALRSGMIPLIESGIEKLAAGLTTLEEIVRIADVVDTRKVVEQQRGLEKDLDAFIEPEDKIFLKDLEDRLLSN